jgi:hypothetical protein
MFGDFGKDSGPVSGRELIAPGRNFLEYDGKIISEMTVRASAL